MEYRAECVNDYIVSYSSFTVHLIMTWALLILDYKYCIKLA